MRDNSKSRSFVMVLYPNEDISHKIALDILKQSYDCAYIEHNRDTNEDGTIKKSHVHVVVQFVNPRSLSGFAKEIHLEPNYIQVTNSFKRALLYLVHTDNKDKVQYNVSEVHGSLQSKLVSYLGEAKITESEGIQMLVDYIMIQHRRVSIYDVSIYALKKRYYLYFPS